MDLIRPYHTRNLPSRHHRHTVTGSANGSTRRIIVRPSQSSMDSNQLSSAARDYRDYLTAVRQMNMDLEELMVSDLSYLFWTDRIAHSSHNRLWKPSVYLCWNNKTILHNQVLTAALSQANLKRMHWNYNSRPTWPTPQQFLCE